MPHPRGEANTSISPLVRSGEPYRGQNYSTDPVCVAVLGSFVVLWCDLVETMFGRVIHQFWDLIYNTHKRDVFQGP